MYQPAIDDEIGTLIGYLEQQLDAIRAAVYGLTEQQARQTPCRSALSVGGIVKHIAYGMAGWVDQYGAAPPANRALDFAGHAASFALTDAETIVEVLADFDSRRAELIPLLRAVDPDAETLAPPAPWFGILTSIPIRNRYQLWHFVEETARHAGHADIIREQLDGQSIAALVMTLQGVPANDFFTPYKPASGTITG